MIRMRRETKYIIIIMVIVISLFLGLKKSNLLNSFQSRKQIVENKEAKKIFNAAENKKKIALEFRMDDPTKIDQKVNELLAEGKIGMKYSDAKSNQKSYVLVVADSSYSVVLQELKEIHLPQSENLKTAPDDKYATNIKANVENQKISKKRIQELINRSTSPERMKLFRSQLERIQTKIDSLENQINIQKANKENNVILLTAFGKMTGPSIGSSIKSFVKTTFLVLIALVIALVIFYYFMVLMIKLMSILGIRTSRGSSSSYGSYGNYNYNRYKSYGRRVKRVYKDKDGKTKREESEG